MKSIKCICPKCRENHSKKMLWIGRGIPRIYCDGCKKSLSKFGNILIYSKGSIRRQSILAKETW